MPYVTTDDGVRLYVEEQGTGPAVVFVHGGAANHDLWEHQVWDLVDDHRTVVYDHRGVHRSDVPRSGYTVDRLAADLRQVIAALALDDVTLVTHGFGGHVAIRALRDEATLAARLVLISAAPAFSGGDDEGGFSDAFLTGFREALGRDHATANWELFERYLFHTDPGTAVKVASLGMHLTWSLGALKQLMADLPAVDHRAVLPTLALPVLVLHGRHDRKNRFAGAEELVVGLPDAELVVLEDSAHMPHLEEVAACNAALRAFVASGGI